MFASVRYALVCMLLLTVPGCFYSRKPVHIPRVIHGYSEHKSGIECRVQPLNAVETKALFGANLLSQGYMPCNVELYNGSLDSYTLSWKYVTVPLTSHYVIKDVSHYNTSLYAFTASLLAAIYCWPLIPVVIVPAALAMVQFNKEVDEIVDEFGLKNDENITLLPYERLNKVIFVYGWQKGAAFDIGLLNNRTSQFIKFTVSL